jgi:molecular chaperone GrpE
MSEPAPQAIARDAALSDAPGLTPAQVAEVLADFQTWLGTLPEAAESAPPSTDSGPDLFTFLEQLTALRHEVNLQTKATRAGQEQHAASLIQLTRALDALQQAHSGNARDGEDGLRPVLKTLIELHDALSMASREAQRVSDLVLPVLPAAADWGTEGPPELPVAHNPPRWVRWLGVRCADLSAYRSELAAWRCRQDDLAQQRRKGIERVQQLLASLTAGYTMGIQRIERALKQHGLEAIAATEQPFDPERMEAIDIVTGSGQPSGRVLDEVQRGYLWNGRVFRFAKVRVAKS